MGGQAGLSMTGGLGVELVSFRAIWSAGGAVKRSRYHLHLRRGTPGHDRQSKREQQSSARGVGVFLGIWSGTADIPSGHIAFSLFDPAKEVFESKPKSAPVSISVTGQQGSWVVGP